MGRALLIMDSDDNRLKAAEWIRKAPQGTRVEFKASRRTLPQNDLLWALLTEVAAQLDHGGRKYSPEEWKAIFLHAFGREITFLPGLDLKTFIPIELSSSDLSKDEMTQFIEFILKEGAERGVVFRQHQDQQTDEGAPSTSSAEAGAPPPASASNLSPKDKQLLVDFCRNGLATVGDERILPGDRRALIGQMAERYAPLLPADWINPMRLLLRTLRAVLEKDRTAAQAKAWFSEVLDCSIDELEPRRA